MLYLGNCLEVMNRIERVDMVLADLPYGTTELSWDSRIPLELLWKHYKRITDLVVLFGSQPFTTALITSNLKWFRYCWVWEKSTPTGWLDANRRPLKAHEDIIVFSRKRPPYYPQMTPAKRHVHRRGRASQHYSDRMRITTDNKGLAYPRSVLYFPTETGFHPTQKPVSLLMYLIETYTGPGMTVLDNTMGSGSTGVACVLTGRDFVGIEIDPDYFEIAKERFDKAGRALQGKAINGESDLSGLPMFDRKE